MDNIWIQLGWIGLILYQFGITGHFLHMYRLDKDKMKLMFGMVFLIGIFSLFYILSGIHETESETLFLRNLYYWSFLPILITLFGIAHHTFFNLERFSFFFKTSLFFIILSFIVVLLLPIPADTIISPVIMVVGFELIFVSLLIVLKNRDVSNLMFFFAVLSFMIAGIAVSRGLEQYYQMFTFFIGYTFLLLIFAYPSNSKINSENTIGDLFALQQQLDETQKQLQITSKTYDDLIEHMNSGVLVLDPGDKGTDFFIKDVNPAAEYIANIKEDQVKGKSVIEVFPMVKDVGLFEVFKEVYDTGKTRKHPPSLYQDDRLSGWIKTTVYKLSIGDIVAVFDDVSKEKEDEIALQHAHRELIQINQKLDRKVAYRTEKIRQLLKQKDEFILQLGHDLKTPLSPIINLLPLVETHEKDPKMKECIQISIKAARRMAQLVKRMNRISKLDSTQIQLSVEQICLFDVVDQAISRVKLGSIEENNIVFSNNVEESFTLEANKKLIGEVLDNLLMNSMKYSPSGGMVAINAVKEVDGVLISVRDHGLGLSADQMDHVFDEFYKADESRHDIDSSGLGLAIVKRIVENHGGHIWVESEGLGKGSVFHFIIPQKKNNDLDGICEVINEKY